MQNPSSNNKTILMYTGIIAVAVIIIGAGAFTLYSANQKVQDQKKKDDESAMMKKEEDDKMMKKTEDEKLMKKESSGTKTDEELAMMKKETAAGTYTTYSQNLVSSATSDKKVVLFFNASWCPTCQATVKDINANLNNLDPKLVLLSADYDKETALKQKYGVTIQHTFVQVDQNGNLIKKSVGLDTVSRINSFIN